MRSRWSRTAVAGAVVAVMSGLGAVTVSAASAGTAGAASCADKSPFEIALITSLTGSAGPEYAQAPAGFNARVDLQNAECGVDGHPIHTTIVNDNTDPATAVTGVQDALSKGVIGIVSDSPIFFAADKYPQQAGVPVTGGFFDGPEWGEQPFTNMFASDAGSENVKYPVNTALGKFVADHGGHVLGSYGYGISPSSTRAAIQAVESFKHAGGKEGVLNTSIPFGSVDMTTEALVAKSKNVDSIWAGLDDNSNFALATALKQAGVKLKVVVFPTGYEPDVINSPAWADLQGDYFSTGFRPFALPNAGTKEMQSALEKYQGWKPSQFPNYSQYESWLGADLMIKGLQLASAHNSSPTSQDVIHALRGIKSYNGNGLLPVSIDYSTIFGHDLSPTCEWYLRAEKTGFVPVAGSGPGGTYCGTDIPGTSTPT